MGACTVTQVTNGGTGNFTARAKSVHFNRGLWRMIVTPSTSYSTGGDTISLTNCPLKTIRYVFQVVSENGSTGMMIPSNSYRNGVGATVDITDPTAPKLKLYTAANTEAAAASNNSTANFVFEFAGN